MSLYPKDLTQLLENEAYNQRWYYSFELLPGHFRKGQYEDGQFLPARKLLRHCDLEGLTCLDVGTMEGLIPSIMYRRKAKAVVATDASLQCIKRINLIRYLHNVDFDFIFTPTKLAYAECLSQAGYTNFDVINLSGILYHVFSPINYVALIRPLLRTGGLMIVSTHVYNNDEYSMQFNQAGSLQPETNTFWNLSVKYFDYMLRFLKLAPIAAEWAGYNDNKSGYLSVLCRGTDQVVAAEDDAWMKDTSRESWEYNLYTRWDLIDQTRSDPVKYHGADYRHLVRPDTQTLDLHKFMKDTRPTPTYGNEIDTCTLGLHDVV